MGQVFDAVITERLDVSRNVIFPNGVGRMLPRIGTAALQSYIAGAQAWYGFSEKLPTGTATALAINTLFAYPYPASLNDGSVIEMALDLSVLGGAGSVARVGIYGAYPQKPFYPSNLLFDSGSIVTDGGGLTKLVSVPSLFLPTGTYWIAYLCGVAAPTVRTWHPAVDSGGVDALWGFNANLGAAGGNQQNLISIALAFGALPGAFPVGAVMNTGFVHGVYLRYA